MPEKNGIWTVDEAKEHLFSYKLARYIHKFLLQAKTSKFGRAAYNKINIVDVGCGNGAYVGYLRDVGFEAVYGIEGTDIPISMQEGWPIHNHDLTLPFNEEFDKGTVICLEVAEHIPEQYLNQFLENMCSLVEEDGYLFMSWAIPGQDGIGHVSCRTNDWVISQMSDRGFKYLGPETGTVRRLIENHLAYFKDTILIFKRK